MSPAVQAPAGPPPGFFAPSIWLATQAPRPCRRTWAAQGTRPTTKPPATTAPLAAASLQAAGLRAPRSVTTRSSGAKSCPAV